MNFEKFKKKIIATRYPLIELGGYRLLLTASQNVY